MSGHGWVTPNPDGSKARCGGPAICPTCAVEAGRVRVFYLLVCLECEVEPTRPSPIPFESAEARGKWAAEHTRGTGHERWWVHDERRAVDSG